MEKNAVFTISHLKYRGILDIDSLLIPKGVITCIVGESGSGKTTLLKMLNHLISPDSGDVTCDGKSVLRWDPIELRRNVVMMSQTPTIFPGTVRDNLQIGLRFTEKDPADDHRLNAMLKRTHLDKPLDADTDSLSGGEKQRVSLARVLLMDPPVLLLDEPSSALDEETTQFIMQELTRYVHETGKTLVMVTHSKAVVREIAEHIIEICGGQLKKEGDLHE